MKIDLSAVVCPPVSDDEIGKTFFLLSLRKFLERVGAVSGLDVVRLPSGWWQLVGQWQPDGGPMSRVPRRDRLACSIWFASGVATALSWETAGQLDRAEMVLSRQGGREAMSGLVDVLNRKGV